MEPNSTRSCVSDLRAASVRLADAAFEAMLADLVAESRVVMIGESHHFVHETFEVRARLLELLGRLGFTRVALELSPHDGAQLHAYLTSGDPESLDRVGLVGALGEGDRPYDGLLGEGVDRYPTAAMRFETVRWLDQLRRSRVHWSLFGFDIEYLPGLAAERLTAISDPDGRQHLQDTLEISQRYDRAVRAARAYPELAEPMAWRENRMADHLRRELTRHPDTRTVVIGHNLHIGAGSDRIDLAGAIGPGGGLVPPVGAQLAHSGITGPCLWSLHDHGHDSGPPPSDGVVRSIPGSLNATLGELGDTPVAVATGSIGCLQERWAIASMYGTTIDAVPAEVCDMILSIPRTTHLHEA